MEAKAFMLLSTVREKHRGGVRDYGEKGEHLWVSEATGGDTAKPLRGPGLINGQFLSRTTQPKLCFSVCFLKVFGPVSVFPCFIHKGILTFEEQVRAILKGQEVFVWFVFIFVLFNFLVHEFP